MKTKRQVAANTGFEEAGFGQRIETIARKVGGVKALAENAGLRSNQLYRYIQGKNVPGVDVVAALAAAAGVSVGWLVTGQNLEGVGERLSGNLIPIPFYPTAERAAMARLGTEVGRLAVDREYLAVVLNVDPDQVYLEVVSDDSMEPTFLRGDVVVVDAGRGERAFGDGVYLVGIDDALMVKRAQHLPDHLVELFSDNPKYRSFKVSVDDRRSSWKMIGPVIAIWRRL